MSASDPFDYRYPLVAAVRGSLPTLTLIPKQILDDDVGSDRLSMRRFRYAQYPNTGALVLVRPRNNRRWLKAWGCHVTDFSVFEVDTVANAEGTGVVAARGARLGYTLFAREEILPYSFLTAPRGGAQ